MFARTFFRGLGLAAILAAVAGSAARAQQLPPARQIVDRHVQAIGGRPAVARFQHRRIVSETSLPDGTTMTADAYQAAPNKTFVRTELPGVGAILAGHDGAVAWSSDPAQGPRALEGNELGEALRQAEFWGYLDPAAAYRSLETVGENTAGGRPCWNVRMVHASGAQAHGCFDKESGLLARTSTEAGAMRVDVTISRVQGLRRDQDAQPDGHLHHGPGDDHHHHVGEPRALRCFDLCRPRRGPRPAGGTQKLSAGARTALGSSRSSKRTSPVRRELLPSS
jgi:hypothetical protein